MGEFGEYGDGIRLTCGEGDSRVNGDFNVEADIVSKDLKSLAGAKNWVPVPVWKRCGKS
jgi:hypothetical protein